MIIHYGSQGLRLDEAENFRAFKLVLAGIAAARPPLEGIRFLDDDNVLVDIALVPGLPGAPQDSAWRAGYEAMIETAAKHGWIDAAGQAIRAHVERTP